MASTQEYKDPMVRYVIEEFERYEVFHQERWQKYDKICNHWKNKPPARAYKWQNAVHVPVTFEAEQTVSPRLFAALFPSEAPVEIKVEGNFPEEQGIKIKSGIQHYFRLSDVQGEAIPALSQMSLLGTGYLYAPWLHKKKWQIGRNGERYEAVVDNRPDCESVDFFEMFPHPAKVKMDDGLPLIRRTWCDAEYLKKLAAMPQFKFSNLNEALQSEPVVRKTQTNRKAMADAKKREEYELLSYWGPWDLTYEKDEKVVTKMAVPHWIMVINRSVMIRGIPNPYNHQIPPFVKMMLYSDIKRNWFGRGVGEVGLPTQERLNKMVNQRLDNVDLVLNKQGCYNGNDNLINKKKLRVSMPGQWHGVSDTVTSLKWMETPDVTASSYKEEELAKNDFRESTGAVAPLMPADEGQHRTASGMNLLQGAAGMRFRPILRKLETDLIQNLAMIYLSNLQQFMALPELVMMQTKEGGSQPIIIKPEDLQAKVHFIPMGLSEMMNKEMEIGQMLRFKEISMNDPTINRVEINRRIAKLMGFKDIQELVVPQKPTVQGEGQLPEGTQKIISQRLAEGASPDQIKEEMLGPRPAAEEEA